MKKFFIILVVFSVLFSCQEDIHEIVPLNNPQTGGGPGPGTDPGTDPLPAAVVGEDNSNIMLGNPSNATADVANENNYLMNKGQFVLSYNRSKAIPNWVSWYIGSTSLGGTNRGEDFYVDTTLPAGWFRVEHGSYSNSGFTRGHNCPSGDRTSSVAANDVTFFMTNMIPQAASNNSGLWAAFESYCRTQVNAGNEVFVIMGNYGVGGTGTSGYATSINGGNIAVPQRIWKVAVIIPNGNGDLARVNASTRVIAIDTPNTNSGLGSWQSYRVSVDAIEAATGYDILSALPDDVEATLESKVDAGS